MINMTIKICRELLLQILASDMAGVSQNLVIGNTKVIIHRPISGSDHLLRNIDFDNYNLTFKPDFIVV